MVDLIPILKALGFSTERQQIAFIKMLAASGAFGKLPDVTGTLSDREALAVLTGLKFKDKQAAAEFLHDITQDFMLRPNGMMRCHCPEPEFYVQNRSELLNASHHLGLLKEVPPQTKYCRDLVVLGAMEGAVSTRLEMVEELHRQGFRFKNLYLVGSERPLDPRHEPIAKVATDVGGVMTEIQMMMARAYEKWPDGLAGVNLIPVTARGCGTTVDNAKSYIQYLKDHKIPINGTAVFVSNAPHIAYQDAAVKSVLTPEMKVETIGARACEDDIKIRVVMDAIARQIHVGFPKLLEALQKPEITPPLDSHPSFPRLAMLDPEEIRIDAATYQFRSGGDKHGVTKKRQGTPGEWDPVLDGGRTFLVHQTEPDHPKSWADTCEKKYALVDGHHGLARALAARAKGKGPDTISALVLGPEYSKQTAKIVGAYANAPELNRGKADPVDIADMAKALKEADTLPCDQKKLLPHLKMEGNIQLAYTLRKLNDTSLEMVARREVPAKIAAFVASQVPAERQEPVMRMISAKLHQNYPNYVPQFMQAASSQQIHIHIHNDNSPFTPRQPLYCMKFKPAGNVVAGILAKAQQQPGEPSLGIGA